MRPGDSARATRPPFRANMLHVAIASIQALITGLSSRVPIVDPVSICEAI